MSGEPKPCPFCGGEAQSSWNDGFPYVVCTKCACSTGFFVTGNEADSIAAWNTRATPSQRLDAATVERCAQVADEYADGCKIAARDEDLTGESLAYTRGCLTGAMAVATRIRTLATEPHQHGGKGA